ncbi:EamA family transporter [bacterium]|nr:EamA family transporter [bacterium]
MEYAFGAAFFFAWSITCARRSSQHHGADLANLARITIAFLAIGAGVLLAGRPLLFPGWPWLLLGGAIGLGVGDIASFHSLTRIGAGLALLVMQTLAAPFALVLEYLALGHAPSGAQLGAAAVILAGVALALGARPVGDPRRWSAGIALSILAAFGQACGAVSTPMAKAACLATHTPLPDGWTQGFLRILGGLPIVLGFVLWNTRRTGLFAQVRRPYAGWRARGWALMNGLSGPGIGVACYQWALSTQPAAVVLSIVALSPLLALLFQWAVEGQRPSPRVWIGGSIAVTGVILLRNL